LLHASRRSEASRPALRHQQCSRIASWFLSTCRLQNTKEPGGEELKPSFAASDTPHRSGYEPGPEKFEYCTPKESFFPYFATVGLLLAGPNFRSIISDSSSSSLPAMNVNEIT